MKKLWLWSILLLLAVGGQAGDDVFKSPLLSGEVPVRWALEKLVSAPGEEERYEAYSISNPDIQYSESRKQPGPDAVEYLFTLKNVSDKPLFLRPSVTADVPFRSPEWWNGYLNLNKLKFDPLDNNLSTWFPANAVYDGKTALILGVDPLKLYSRVDSDKIGADGKEKLFLALPVYLEPGKTFEYSYVVAASNARYGYHDVIQKWYDLFPAVFNPADQIDPDLISGEASYLYWKPEVVKYNFVSDLLRRIYGGRGCWEWCYRPFVRGGDWAITDEWTVGWQGWTKERVEEFRQNIHRRLAPAAFQGVAPMWYLNVSWTEWSLWEEHFKGIELAFDGKKRRCWSQDTIYGIYPWGSAYGKLFMQGLANVPKEFPEARGIGWDSCFAHKPVPQGHAGFAGTDPKSYDRGNPIALEAVGVSQLLDYSREQFSGKTRMGNAVNFKLVSPYSIGVRTDAGLYEGQPMHAPNRLLRTEAMRARFGTRKALVWHKAGAPEFMKWVDWEDMGKSEIADAYRQIMDNVYFLNYYWGALAAPNMPTIGVENLMKSTPELVDLIRLGWQPSPGVDVPETILAARYGQGPGSRIAVINPEFKDQEFTLHFPPAYWDGKAVLAGAEDGSALNSKINAGGTSARVRIPARSVFMIRVLCAGGLPSAEIEAIGSRVAVDGSAPFWRFELKTAARFAWELLFARTGENVPVRIKCNDESKRYGAADALRYTLDSANWPEDVQSANLNTAQLEFREYARYSADEVDLASLKDWKLPELAEAGRLVIRYSPGAAQAVKDEAERIGEWFRFYTQKGNKFAEPQFNGQVTPETVVVSLETGRDELKDYQDGRAFSEGKSIRICAASPGDMRLTVLAFLERMDQAYPFYGELPDSPEFRKFGLNGQTLTNAPAKKVFRPTLLEMLRTNKIK
jgi:hypothetical protein